MSSYLDDVKKAGNLMAAAMRDRDCNDSFGGFTLCYCFSNENLAEYYPKYISSGSSVLTVCGSGDQVLSAILYGAKKVDCFDSNRLAYYNLMLKIYAVKYLDFRDFYFLYNLSNRVCDRKMIYEKFSSMIELADVSKFWNSIFAVDSKCFPYLFRERNNNMEDILLRIPYMTEDNFNKLKVLICDCEISFEMLNLFDVVDKYHDKYDFINFSNILDYVDSNQFISFIQKVKTDNLNVNGNIMVNYSWSEADSIEFYNSVSSSIGASQHSINPCFADKQAGSIMVCRRK